jgi:hypothetical protein
LIPETELQLEETDGASNDSGYVYLIAECERGAETGYYKVGTASNPKKRIKDLQTGNVRLLKFWGDPVLVAHRLTVEKVAHDALSDYACDLGGGKEWFRATQRQKRDFYKCYWNATKCN